MFLGSSLSSSSFITSLSIIEIDKLLQAPAPAEQELVLVFAPYTHHHPNFTWVVWNI